jgi:hypothetical protein
MVRVRYELDQSDVADAPVLSLLYSTGRQNPGLPLWGFVVWGGFTWPDPALAEFMQAAGQAGLSDGRAPYTWRVEAHGRIVRYRIVCTRPCARLVIRSIESHVRQSARP